MAKTFRAPCCKRQSVKPPVDALTWSPVKGPEGNIEFLAHLALGEGDSLRPDPEEIVEGAHRALDKGAEE